MLKICLASMSYKGLGLWGPAVHRVHKYAHHSTLPSFRTTILVLRHHSFYNRPIVLQRVIASNSVFRSCPIHCSGAFLGKEPSKVEETVKVLKEIQKTKHDQDQSSSFTTSAAPVAVPKRSLPKRFWDELVHYYHGFRLMFIDLRVSSRLAWKILIGGDLSRREHKQGQQYYHEWYMQIVKNCAIYMK